MKKLLLIAILSLTLCLSACQKNEPAETFTEIEPTDVGALVQDAETDAQQVDAMQPDRAAAPSATPQPTATEPQKPDYARLYGDYITAEKWRTEDEYLPEYARFELSNEEYFVGGWDMIDVDKDGVPEMWLTIVHEDWTMGSFDFFFMTDGTTVTPLVGTYMSGGTVGGEMLDIAYDKERDTFMLASLGHAGGFGGFAGYYTVWDWSGGVLTKVADFDYIEQAKEDYSIEAQNDPNLVEIADGYCARFSIGDKSVPQEEYEALVERYLSSDYSMRQG